MEMKRKNQTEKREKDEILLTSDSPIPNFFNPNLWVRFVPPGKRDVKEERKEDEKRRKFSRKGIKRRKKRRKGQKEESKEEKRK